MRPLLTDFPQPPIYSLVPPLLRKWISITGALAALAVWAYFLPWQRALDGHNDFLGQYCGARLVGSPLLHDHGANATEQIRAAHVEMSTETFMRPDYYAALLWPLGQLPFPIAYRCFVALNIVAFLVVLWLLRERKELLLLCAVSIPFVTSLSSGQDLPILLAALLGAFHLDRTHRSFSGGLCFALCAIKPHLFIFVPISLLAGRRWRMLAGASTGFVALFLLAVACQGWHWLPDYLSFLRSPDLHPVPFPMPNLRGFASALSLPGATVEIAGLIAILLWLGFTVWETRHSKPQIEHLAAMAMAAAFLLSWHLGVQDCLLFIAIAAFASVKSRLYQVSVWLAAPITYFLAAASLPISAIPALLLAGGFFASSRQAGSIQA